MLFFATNEWHQTVTSYRFEPIHDGHHYVSSVVPFEIEEVDEADCPKVDAGDPWQDSELETLGQVWPVCVERLIGHLQGRQADNRMSNQASQPAALLWALRLAATNKDSKTNSHCTPTQQVIWDTSILKRKEKLFFTYKFKFVWHPR